MKFLYLNIFILVCAFSFGIKAQTNITPPAPLPPKIKQCTTDLFSQAEYLYQMRKFRGSEGHSQAEPYIKKILDVCPNADLMPYLKKRLEVLTNERAEHNFIVGKYFLKLFRRKEKTSKGAEARFLQILNKFPNYSKTDEVLFLLGETYLLDKKHKKARDYFQKVLDRFPKSKFFEESKKKIDYLKLLEEKAEK